MNDDPVTEIVSANGTSEWWFYDETWSDMMGPFKSREDAKCGAQIYNKVYLLGEPLNDEDKAIMERIEYSKATWWSILKGALIRDITLTFI